MDLGLGPSQRVMAGFIGVQAANAALDAVALYPIAESTGLGRRAKEWAAADLDRLGFPRRFRFLFPIIKASSVAGLLAGLRWRALGRLTATAVVAYFVAALGFHLRAKDPVRNYIPAVGMLVWACGVFRGFWQDT